MQVSIEVIMKVAELLPDDVLRIVVSVLPCLKSYTCTGFINVSFCQAGPWKECSTVYFTLENHVSNGSLNVSPAELTHLHSVMRDFTSLLQLIGRISALFVGEEFLARISEGNELVKQLIMLASFGAKSKFYDLPGIQREMAQVFVDV